MTHPFLFHPQVAPWFKESAGEHASTDTLLLTLFSELDAPIEAVWLRHEPDNEEYLLAMTPVRAHDRLQVWQVELPLTKGQDIHLYCFKCLTAGGQWWLHGAGVSPAMPAREQHFRFNSRQQPPAWVQDQVFYQIFPDRFCDGDPALSVRQHEYEYRGKPVISKPWGAPVSSPAEGHAPSEFYGGDLAGIGAKLDYLQALGITALYLNPIFASPSNHKYDTQDYYKIDPHLGSNAQFAELTRDLHERGIRILLDAVVNHTSTAHPWFCPPQGAQNNPDSPWRSFYTFDREGDYVSWKGIRSLPKLDFASQQVQDAVYRGDDAILRHWLRAPYHIDGWRLDVIHMLGEQGSAKGNREHVRAIRAAMKQENPDAYVLGEHFFEASQWLQGDQEDGAMNYYGFAHPIRAFLAGQDIAYHPIRIDATELDSWLKRARAHLPFKNQLAQFNLLDSHDTARFLHLLGEGSQRMGLAATLLLTYIGAPSIYYGDEVGLSGGNDPDCRRCFPWNTADWDEGLHQHYRRLIALRRQHPALRQGDIQTLHAGGDGYVFARTLHGDQVIVACNRHPTEPLSLSLPLWQIPDAASRFADAVDGTGFEVVEGQLQIRIPANSARVLVAI